MTNEQIKAEVAYRMTQKYLIYLAYQEIMLDNYEDVEFLKDFDRDLLTKHKNMVSSLKRNASKAYRFLQTMQMVSVPSGNSIPLSRSSKDCTKQLMREVISMQSCWMIWN